MKLKEFVGFSLSEASALQNSVYRTKFKVPSAGREAPFEVKRVLMLQSLSAHDRVRVQSSVPTNVYRAASTDGSWPVAIGGARSAV